MRKYLLWPLILLLSLSIVFQSETKRISDPMQGKKESITFTMYSDQNYSTNAYKDAMAQPHIIINKLKGDVKTIVWDKTYDFKHLRDYSSLQNHVFETVVINNLNSRENLEVVYVVTYCSHGSVLQMYNDTVFNSRMKSGEVEIDI